jgi:hypothetical protein
MAASLLTKQKTKLNMTKTISRFALASLLAAFTLGVVAQLPAQEKKEGKKEESPAAPAKQKKRDTAPFRGKIDAVDKTAKTIKVGERTFQVTSTTRIMKAGKPATLDDATVGEEVGGQYKKTEDGKLELVTLRIGPRPERPEREAKPEKPPKKTE